MPYTLPDLDYDYAALEPHYSAEMLELHHDKHHEAYVEGVNATLEQLDGGARERRLQTDRRAREDARVQPVRARAAHALLAEPGPDGGDQPDGRAGRGDRRALRLVRRVPEPAERGDDHVQGSGWGALAWEPLGQRLFIEQIYDHQGNIGQGCGPLLVLDAWEHAYYLQYQNERPDYVEAIWNIVDWADVGRRFERARRHRPRVVGAASSARSADPARDVVADARVI